MMMTTMMMTMKVPVVHAKEKMVKKENTAKEKAKMMMITTQKLNMMQSQSIVDVFKKMNKVQGTGLLIALDHVHTVMIIKIIVIHMTTIISLHKEHPHLMHNTTDHARCNAECRNRISMSQHLPYIKEKLYQMHHHLQ